MIGRDEILNASILIVDDSAVNVSLLERLLAASGYTTVTSTTDPTTVCALHASNRYDLILLDIAMPVMDGFAVLEGLKAIETDGYVPVVVLTAQPDHELRALAAGARDFVSKPFQQREVLKRIENALETRLLLQESRSYNKLLEQFDQLTGLPNRRRFCAAIDAALLRAESARETLSVLFISVDRFKAVSDVLGRSIGGAVLSSVADRLIGCLGPMTTIARLEGADFGVLLVSPDGDTHAAAAMAQQLRNALRQALSVAGHELSVTVSIGIAISPADSMRTDELLAFASSAMGEARADGGDGERFYSADTNARAAVNLDLELALRGALDRDEFVLTYQPKLHIASGEWSSAEALIRWERPDHGTISPMVFIPVLEETGMIVAVGAWVINTACRQIAAWSEAGLGDICVAVNVSGRQFAHPSFVADVAEAIRANGIQASSLDIEITESSLMARTKDTAVVLHALKALGVRIAIDDFGTGYSSLSYLKRYPIDTLKIDASFIRDITHNEDDAAIAVTIINMARILKMSVIAEGVETEPQLEFLRKHHCDAIQGYLFSKPLPALGITALRTATGRTPTSTPAAAPQPSGLAS